MVQTCNFLAAPTLERVDADTEAGLEGTVASEKKEEDVARKEAWGDDWFVVQIVFQNVLLTIWIRPDSTVPDRRPYRSNCA